MDRPFAIDFEWLDRPSAEGVERYSFASLTVSVADQILTELEDLNSRTVRASMRGSAYDLAVWLLQNWWRLVAEPERNTLDWKMSHCMGTIGMGFLWPDACFLSDGLELTVQAQPTPRSSKQMVRYLNEIHAQFPVDAFANEVLAFADAVIGRLQETGFSSTPLQELRQDIMQELTDPDMKRWRTVEALLGYDPDCAPEALVEEMIAKSDIYGSAAIDELIAFGGQEIRPIMNWLTKDASDATTSVIVPEADILRKQTSQIDPSLLPWQRAEKAASIVKRYWSIAQAPISTRQLTDLFSMKIDALTEGDMKAPMSIGFRNSHTDHIDAALASPFEANRRFALLRVVADHLYSPDMDRLLPVTTARTARQKYQRAFAQAFLCPAEQLIGFIDGDLSDEKIDKAADYFNVSPRLVESTLFNKGVLKRADFADL
ncbi:hypothetical protein FGF66_06785 [Chlorobaculum thiosulfatiphilum]|uniref:Uncharacterized protein n=1 Tax=Chlorobaculum thiosulfatiphilum TaxID=115852 RepID=A0A5C4S6T4_CHLTI|nr:hypothetical protein [Chlorobaculum thiosulfatiphilum]TNJ38962.1 hypothetical protein FGF66_06785 [Chlorobaculum thiosulfatiphilum]